MLFCTAHDPEWVLHRCTKLRQYELIISTCFEHLIEINNIWLHAILWILQMISWRQYFCISWQRSSFFRCISVCKRIEFWDTKILLDWPLFMVVRKILEFAAQIRKWDILQKSNYSWKLQNFDLKDKREKTRRLDFLLSLKPYNWCTEHRDKSRPRARRVAIRIFNCNQFQFLHHGSTARYLWLNLFLRTLCMHIH